MNRSELVAGQIYYDNYYGEEVTFLTSFDPDFEGDDVVIRREGNVCAFSKSRQLSLPPITRGVYCSPLSRSLLYVLCPVCGQPGNYHTFIEYYTGTVERQIMSAASIRRTWSEHVGDLPEYPLDRGIS